MIAELSVSQLAIIDQTDLVLGPGFTVLTGETGAGKSLLVDAIQLILGERAETELVRANSKSAIVSVVFDVSQNPEIEAKCLELGVPLEESQLFVTREVFAEGRSQSRIGGRLTPNSTLRQIGELLVDLHGQHDHQSLLQQEKHLNYLDRWIGPEADGLLKRVAQDYSHFAETDKKLRSLRANLRERDHRIDLLRHQIGEIDAVTPQVGEFAALQSLISRLQHLEKLTSAIQSAQELLSTGEGSAIEQVQDAAKQLESAEKFDASVTPMLGRLNEFVFELEDVSGALAKFLSGLDDDPEELETHIARVESLKRLRRKYGDDEEAIIRYASDAKSELAILEDVEASEESLELVLADRSAALQNSCAELTALRLSNSKAFSAQVEEQLNDLALPNARFGVGMKPADPSPLGADEVEFVFSANPGEPLRPLQRVASGGEVSRLMLALKTVLAGKVGVPTLIFDEVDSGLGGRVGATIGRKLADLAERYQVVVISHLPQVAAQAHTHFRIEKVQDRERTATRVRKLNSEERLEEIARMLAGENVTETARAHAKEMLAQP